MKSFLEDYSRIIGFILLTFVVILLLATPSMIFAHACIIKRNRRLDRIG